MLDGLVRNYFLMGNHKLCEIILSFTGTIDSHLICSNVFQSRQILN